MTRFLILACEALRNVARSYLLKELHETELVAVLLRDAHANHIGGSSNQSSISFKHRN